MAPFLCSVIAPAVTSTDHAASVTDRGYGHADTTNSGSTWAASQAYLRDHAVRLRGHLSHRHRCHGNVAEGFRAQAVQGPELTRCGHTGWAHSPLSHGYQLLRVPLEKKKTKIS